MTWASLACSVSVGLSSVLAAPYENKLIITESAELERIVSTDITERQALITADFTRSIYSEEATFKDEIDTYPIDKYIQGTKALFIPEKSHVDLLETLRSIRISLLSNSRKYFVSIFPWQPKVSLSGYVELFRDSKDGLDHSFRRALGSACE